MSELQNLIETYREARSLTLCRWDEVPLYWRQRLIPDSRN